MMEFIWYPGLVSVFLFSFFFFLCKESYTKIMLFNKLNGIKNIKFKKNQFISDYYYLIKFIYIFSLYIYIIMFLSGSYFFTYSSSLIFFNFHIYNYVYYYNLINIIFIIVTLLTLFLNFIQNISKPFEFLIGIIFFFTCIQYYLIFNNLIALILIFEFQSLIFIYLLANNFNLSMTNNINTLKYNLITNQPIWYFNSIIYQFWVSFIGALLLIYTTLVFFKITSFIDWANFEIYIYMKNNININFNSLQLIGLFLPLLLGFFLKLGSLPFFLWKPEIYKNFNLTILFIYMGIYSFSILYFFIIFNVNYLFLLRKFIYPYIYIVSILTFIFISMIIYAITEIRAFLAYTSIFHLTFILIPLYMNSLNTVNVSYFYLLIYLFFIFFTFFIFFAINNNNQLWYFSDIQFFFKATPIITGFSILMVSMAGIPPFIGFFAKLSVISLLLYNNEYLLFFFALFSGFFIAYFYLQNYRFYGYSLKNINYSKNIFIVKNNNHLFIIIYLFIYINIFSFFFLNDLLIFSDFLSILK